VINICLHFFSIGKGIDVQELESVLQTINVKLSESQMTDLKQNLQVDGKIFKLLVKV